MLRMREELKSDGKQPTQHGKGYINSKANTALQSSE